MSVEMSCVSLRVIARSQVAGDKEDQIGDPSKVHVKGKPGTFERSRWFGLAAFLCAAAATDASLPMRKE